jgi:spore maturation protein CgeB
MTRGGTKLVVFGLTVSSSWGNGHATLWRGLIAALARRGWQVVFYEHDEPYYAHSRDLTELPGGRLVLYEDWESIRRQAEADVADADAAMVTSYCPDGIPAGRLVGSATTALKLFYDLDTPVTLSRLEQGETVPYIGPEGLGAYDLVLSFTGGGALDALQRRLGARRVAALYGHADPAVHRPGLPLPAFAGDLSYIGTYAPDRQAALEQLLIEPARRLPARRFVIAGAQYPASFPWTDNIHFVRHLPPADHARFYASSRLTLNVTRAAMAAYGWCPSGRLFEAAACAAPIVTDRWPGLETFFAPDSEILSVDDTGDVVAALSIGDAELRRIGEAAQARLFAEHTSDRRAEQFEALLDGFGPAAQLLAEEA